MLIDTLDHSYVNLRGANYTIEFGLRQDSGDVKPIPNSVYDAQPDPRACNGQPLGVVILLTQRVMTIKLRTNHESTSPCIPVLCVSRPRQHTVEQATVES